MDFNNREIKPQHTTVASAPHPAAAPPSKQKKDQGKWGRIGFVAAVGLIVVLLVGLATLFATGDATKNEYKYVDSSKLQAVFLNTGQVYFGSIKSLNNNYFVLANIYYLQTASSGGTTSAQSTNSNVTLVKLGCELHEPYDQMVINSDQVTFWENLSPQGQVATAVAKFKEQNPQGQKCTDQSSSSSSNSSNSVQSAGSNSAKP
jgi:hypothetical protein